MPTKHQLRPCGGDTVADRAVTRRYVQQRLAGLPARPEEADARLRGLLEIYEELNATGHPEPLTLLAGVLGIPVEILIGHLRAARRR
ncbi:hypothetical protein [Micromonospora endophytica]|uniref:Uncharacterized protein n=1 Tax=Micromonospora endophytica TaxID=515350 RepID=A0A2W2CDU6_9ACTN|nr:hypothetical protein [Micromonospora endophytica]PZF86389.1 hypothetical protein C1I93_27770 [Micromonospora endophytica]RIW45711.1 hypothetical protein D3H59_14870 [Micromonospora endophytica]BCJ62783.1 hypothetical protein Jiend_62050 [Micromonospora endophytica]